MRQRLDRLRRNAAFFRRPRRRFLNAVRFAEKIVAVFRKADGLDVFFNKRLVIGSAAQQHIRQRHQHGGVRAGDPLVGEGADRHGVARVDDDDGNAALARHFDVPREGVRRSLMADGRVAAPEHDRLRVRQHVRAGAGGPVLHLPALAAGHELRHQARGVIGTPAPALRACAPVAHNALEGFVRHVGAQNG